MTFAGGLNVVLSEAATLLSRDGAAAAQRAGAAADLGRLVFIAEIPGVPCGGAGTAFLLEAGIGEELRTGDVLSRENAAGDGRRRLSGRAGQSDGEAQGARGCDGMHPPLGQQSSKHRVPFPSAPPPSHRGQFGQQAAVGTGPSRQGWR